MIGRRHRWTPLRAVNTADYVSFQETCTPSTRKLPTIAQLKLIYEENWGSTGALTLIRFSPQGYNVRNVEVKLLRAPFAQTSFDIYDYDKLVTGRMYEGAHHGGPVSRTFEKVGGQWYSESAPCRRG